MARVKPMIRKPRVSKGKPYTKEGLISRGTKRPGFKELSWNKSDLDKFLK